MSRGARGLPGRARRIGLVVAVLGAACAEPATATQVPGESVAEASVTYTGEAAANLDGGLRRGVVGLGNLDATLRLDGGPLLGWRGATLFLYGLASHGGEPTELTGDAQVVSNIEAPDAVRLYEAWLEQNLAGPKLSLLAGLYDVNSEFSVLEEAGVFLNSSFGIGAEFGSAGVNGPSIFPVTSLGARIQWHPTHEAYLQGALLDGVPGDPDDPGATAVRLSASEGALWVAEVGWLAHRTPAQQIEAIALGRDHVHERIAWRAAAGVWQFTRRTERIGSGRAIRAHPGVYLLAEARPYRETDPDQGLGVFLQLGIADGRAYRFARYTGAGVTYTGLVDGRDRDVAGLGLATAYNGEPYEVDLRGRGRTVTGRETTVEATYRARLAPWLVAQPDLQLVFDPNTDPTLDTAVLAALRVTLSF